MRMRLPEETDDEKEIRIKKEVREIEAKGLAVPKSLAPLTTPLEAVSSDGQMEMPTFKEDFLKTEHYVEEHPKKKERGRLLKKTPRRK